MFHRSVVRSVLRILIAALLLGTASGCVTVRIDAGDKEMDRQTRAKLAQMKEGQTTREEIVKALGPPTRSIKFGKGRELITYEHGRKARTGVTLFLLLNWTTQDEATAELCFELKDGILVRYWTKKSPDR